MDSALLNVLLLREPTSDQPDSFKIALGSLGYDAHSLAVLETASKNEDGLQRILHGSPLSANLKGIIVTSARAANALKNSIKHPASEDHRGG